MSSTETDLIWVIFHNESLHVDLNLRMIFWSLSKIMISCWQLPCCLIQSCSALLLRNGRMQGENIASSLQLQDYMEYSEKYLLWWVWSTLWANKGLSGWPKWWYIQVCKHILNALTSTFIARTKKVGHDMLVANAIQPESPATASMAGYSGWWPQQKSCPQ